jgi:dienelactone hydrolase
MKTADVEYRDGALTCRGFLAYDETKTGRRPGIVVVHEAFGLGQHAMDRAKMLAGLGYVAFAADMFGDRLQVPELPKAIEIISDLLGNPAKLLARLNAAVDVLRQRPEVDTTRLGGIGFCFGGSTVLQLARSGADLKGVVSFHGALSTRAPAKPGAVKAAVLVCTGADDPLIPTDQVTTFEEEMRTAKADWQVIQYGSAVHSFTNPQADGSLNPAILYNEKTDKRSWAAMRDFFQEAFGA